MKLRQALFSPDNRHLWMAGFAGFMIAGAATAPASIVEALIEANAPLVEIGGARGTIWKGEFANVAYGDVGVGRVVYELRPAQLLAGRISADLTSDGGALLGRARVSAGFSGVEVQDLSAQFNLGAIRRYNFYGMRYQGVATVAAGRLALSGKRCRAEAATISTTLFDGVARQWTGAAFPMSGVFECAADTLVLKAAGTGPAGDLRVEAALAPDMSYTLTATAAAKRAEIDAALRQMGFEERGAQLVFHAAGRLKGIG